MSGERWKVIIEGDGERVEKWESTEAIENWSSEADASEVVSTLIAEAIDALRMPRKEVFAAEIALHICDMQTDFDDLQPLIDNLWVAAQAVIGYWEKSDAELAEAAKHCE